MLFDLAGNDAIKSIVRDYTENRSMPHAVIVCGPPGTGKHTVANHLIMSLGCKSTKEKPCGKCEACRKIEQKISPDVIYIGCEGKRKTIGIESVRTIRENAYIIPNDLDVKVFVIDDASLMTVQAQNALLKLLEEPPENVFFVLIASDPSLLLTTVRSRAPELKLAAFSGSELKELLLERSERARELFKKDPDAFLGIVNSAQGSYGRSISALESKKSQKDEISLVLEYLTVLSGFSKGELYGFISLLPLKQREDAVAFCEKLMFAFRDMIASRKSDSPEMMLFASCEGAREFALKYPFAALVSMYSITEQIFTELSTTNVNLTTEYTTLAKRLWAAKL